MLDDLNSSFVDSSLVADQGVARLNLNLSFLRPAQLGQISGHAQLLRRGRDICQVTGTLQQNGKQIATAFAVCKIVSM